MHKKSYNKPILKGISIIIIVNKSQGKFYKTYLDSL